MEKIYFVRYAIKSTAIIIAVKIIPNDKTVIEIKLTTNNQTVHGFEVQIEEYAKSEKTDKKIFMMIDNGGLQKRINDVYKIYEERKINDENPAEIILIDAIPKVSASKYNPTKKTNK